MMHKHKVCLWRARFVSSVNEHFYLADALHACRNKGKDGCSRIACPRILQSGTLIQMPAPLRMMRCPMNN